MNTQEISLREKAINWYSHKTVAEQGKLEQKYGHIGIGALYLKEHPQEFPSLLESGEGADIFNPDTLFQQAVNISKAHAYDIVNEQAKELQAENEKLKRLLESLTPGGSEFVNDPERCAAFAKEQIQGIPKAILPFKRESERLSALNGELVEALEKCIERMERARGILKRNSDSNWGMLDTTHDNFKTLLSKAKEHTT